MNQAPQFDNNNLCQNIFGESVLRPVETPQAMGVSNYQPTGNPTIDLLNQSMGTPVSNVSSGIATYQETGNPTLDLLNQSFSSSGGVTSGVTFTTDAQQPLIPNPYPNNEVTTMTQQQELGSVFRR